MKKRIILVIITVSVCIASIILLYLKFNTKFEVNTIDKYIFTTDMKWLTMQNDGGSHINIYYQVDLQNNIIKKCQDEYKGFKGYVYKG